MAPKKPPAAPQPSTVELKVKVSVTPYTQEERERLLAAKADELAAENKAARLAAEEAGEEPPEEQEAEEDDETPIEEQFEGLGCTFTLSLPGCSEEESEVINADSFEHEFAIEITVSEDMAIQICQEVEGNITLNQASEDAPLIILPVDIAPLVAGDRHMSLDAVSLASTALALPPFFVKSFTLSIILDEDILSKELRLHLNPLCITLLSLNDLPAHDVSSAGAKLTFDDLRASCRPAYCQYSFLGEDVETQGLLQGKSLKFRHKKVFCTGKHDPEDIMASFKTQKVRVTVHDRDKRDAETEEEASVTIGGVKEQDSAEGGDGEVKKAGEKAPVWSGLKTIDYERWKTPRQPDPVGIADLDLSEMVSSSLTSLVLTVDIFPLPDDKEMLKASVTRKPAPKAAFLDKGSTVTVKIQLSHPLSAVGEDGPFQRIVVIVPYGDNESLKKIEEIVVRRNCRALNGHVDAPLDADMDPQMLKKSLSTVELAEEQQQDPNLDVITGIQVIQANHRMFILEGPFAINGFLSSEGVFEADLASAANKKPDPKAKKSTPVKGKAKNAPPPPEPEVQKGAIVELVEALPRLDRNSHPGTKILYNPDLSFSRRLYGEYDADIRRIRLRMNLKELITRADSSLEEKYRPCSLALNRLWDIIRSKNMRQVRMIAGFPEVSQLTQLYKKFGDKLMRQDLDGVSNRGLSPSRGALRGGSRGASRGKPEAQAEEQEQVDPEDLAAMGPGRVHRQPPTESHNPNYATFKQMQKEMVEIDFKDKNINNVHLASEANRGKGLRPMQITVDDLDPDIEVVVYSTQRLAFAQLHLDALRHRFRKDHGKVHWTYSKDFLSGALVLYDPEEEKRRLDALSRARWMTSNGLRAVHARPPEEFRKLPKQLTGWEADQLKLPWEDPTKRKSNFHPLDSTMAGHAESQELHGEKRFERYHAHAAPQMYGGQVPVFGHSNPGYMDSIHAVIGGGMAERAARLAKEQHDFHDKMKGEHKHFMALLKQPAKANQIDKLTTSILKDAPRSYFGRTMPAPQGVTTAMTINANALGEWKNPADTISVMSYGVSLRIKQDENGSKKMNWLEPMAVGVKEKREIDSVHDKPFNHFKIGEHDICDKAIHRIKLPALLNARGQRRQQEDTRSAEVQMLYGRKPVAE